MYQIKTGFLLILLALSFDGYTQDKSADANSISQKTTQDFMVVGGVGVAGAVLGLSTLSFVEKPMEHLKNITIGASIGVILGVALVAYNQATSTRSNLARRREPINLAPHYAFEEKSRDFYGATRKKEAPILYLSHIFSF